MIKNYFKTALRNLRWNKSNTLINLLGLTVGITVPIAYYLMSKWLQDYAYHVSLSVSLFVVAMIGSMPIAWITIGHRAI